MSDPLITSGDRGRALLGAYLAAEKLTLEAFAPRIGSHASHVGRLLSKDPRHQRNPGGALAFAIEEATGGKVPASAWFEKAVKKRHAKRIAKPAQ